MNLYGVYGASGFGREIMPLLRAQVAKDPDAQCVFVDDAGADDTLNGHRRMTSIPQKHGPSLLLLVTVVYAKTLRRNARLQG